MVDSLATTALETLRDLLIEEAKFLYGVSGRVEQVQRDLKTMHSFLKDADKWSDRYDPASLRNWVANLIDLASTAENVLEKYVVQVTSIRESRNLKKKLKRFACIFSECYAIHQVGKETEAIKSRLTDLIARLESMTQVESSSSSAHDQQQQQHYLLRLTYAHEVEEHFVGMENDIARLLSLVEDDIRPSNRVISICGMGGIGKTTLARKIYQHQDLQRGFEARAWVCVTETFQAKNVLSQILRQILPNEKKEQIRNMEQQELVEELHNFQVGKRCLIVLDDIWETDHWDILKPAFPIAGQNCKVLMTTRNEKIASQEYCVYRLGCLTVDQGWELLQKIALPIDLAPVLKTELWRLKAIGRQMIQKCGCLPLAIKVLGGILRLKQTSGEWERVSENIDSHLKHGEGVGSNTRIQQVLDLSYNVLPYYLKSCFLYLGCFPEDQEIYTERLYLLWMAEGLISYQDKGSNETLRDVAERYLSELALRCMVQVQMDELFAPYNKFKSCRLHDLMHDLCLSKGEETGFVKLIDSGKNKNYIVPTEDTVKRLTVIHFDGDADYLDKRDKLKGLRSLVLLNEHSDRWSTVGLNNNTTIFSKLKFLRILVLENYRFKDRKLPSEVGKLIHLRYLSLFRSNVDMLPSSVCNLPYLHTLDLRVWARIELPDAFRKMKRLRHLFLHKFKGELVWDELKELETLQGLVCRWGFGADISKLTNLRYLSARVYDTRSLSMIVDHMSNNQSLLCETCLELHYSDFGSEEDSNVFRKMLMSQSLISLRLHYGSGCRFPCYESGYKLERIPDHVLRSITTLQELETLRMPKKFNDRLRGYGQDYNKVRHIPLIRLRDALDLRYL
ncbi:hypothetical protein DH2020_027746 [Rehmannia glutinosa]|uniref:Uncharacterized protein n=1 Tax=Rehmannia glutinosa TaxID=99300 RepID=A0ABR0VX55_REHGL